MWSAGRWGYSKKVPGNGGGISTKRLTKKSTLCPIKMAKEEALELLKQEKFDEAFDCVMNSPTNYNQKATFLKLNFPMEF